MFDVKVEVTLLSLSPQSDPNKKAKIAGAMLGEEFDTSDMTARSLKVVTRFRVQNLDVHPNSLNSEVLFSGWLPRRTPIQFALTIRDVGALTLPPRQPKDVEAVNDAAPASYIFSWFQTYTLTPTVGGAQKIRVWNASKQPVGALKFYFFLLLFRFCG
jgi:hypothetical protein